MQTSKFYKVAGHVFQVSVPEGNGPSLFSLMDNYQPFEICGSSEAPAQEEIFRLEVSGETSLVEFTEETRQQDEGQEIICGKTADGKSVFVFYLGKKLTGSLICDIGFKKSTLRFPEEGTAHFKKFALNNGLMILFALATAGEQTALFHSAVIAYEGKGYMFLGKSGTGKSTHARMWLSRFKEATLLNDDNPVVRFEDTGVWVYGSPWSGKTPCYKNSRMPLQAIVDLSQAPANVIQPIGGIKAYMAVKVSISGMRWNRTIADGLHNTENRLAQEVKMFHLDCLPNEDAAEVCYQAASKEK